MGLFKKTPKETKETVLSSVELRKQLEMAEKLEAIQKQKELEQKQKEIEKKQFNEIEDVEDFITDDEEEEKDLTSVIEQYVENNGVESTISYLYSVITRLNVQLVLESLEQNPELKEDNEESEPEFKE